VISVIARVVYTTEASKCSIENHGGRIFTVLHALQTRSSDENSVCPSICLSVCPSVKHVDCDKMEERSIQIFMPYETSFSLVF